MCGVQDGEKKESSPGTWVWPDLWQLYVKDTWTHKLTKNNNCGRDPFPKKMWTEPKQRSRQNRLISIPDGLIVLLLAPSRHENKESNKRPLIILVL